MKRRTGHIWASILFLTGFAVITLANPVKSHVILLDPNGGEILNANSSVFIRWQISIAHDLENWDLWYSTSGPTGPWTVVATDLPAGDPTAGSIHSYEWTVPDDGSEQVRVRVRMDNGSFDYEAISADDLTIIGSPSVCCMNNRGNANNDPEDKANVADVSFLVSWLFGIPSGPSPACIEEANANGDPEEKANVSDISFLVNWLFGIPSGPAPSPCP